MTENQDVVFLKLLCYDSCKDWLVIWDEVISAGFLFVLRSHIGLFFEFIQNIYQSCNVVVLDLS